MNSFAKLNFEALKEHCGACLNNPEIRTTLKLRDFILAIYQRILKEKGDKAVFP
jgi:hypothetical protein